MEILKQIFSRWKRFSTGVLVAACVAVCVSGVCWGQSSGISYQPVFSHLFGIAVPQTQSVVLNNIGQVSHTLNWNLTNHAGSPANTCTNYINGSTSSPSGYGTDDNLLFFIEGSYDGVVYQKVTSVVFPLRDITSNPGTITTAFATTPTLAGTVVGNGNFPFIRAGFYNITLATTPANNVFLFCELNAMYIGTSNYISSADADSINNNLNYMYTFSQTTAATGAHTIVGQSPVLFNNAWYDKRYYYIYGVTICSNKGTGQAVSIGDGTGIYAKSLQFSNLAPGCMQLPYTGKAYAKVDSGSGMAYTVGVADTVSVYVVYRPEVQ